MNYSNNHPLMSDESVESGEIFSWNSRYISVRVRVVNNFPVSWKWSGPWRSCPGHRLQPQHSPCQSYSLPGLHCRGCQGDSSALHLGKLGATPPRHGSAAWSSSPPRHSRPPGDPPGRRGWPARRRGCSRRSWRRCKPRQSWRISYTGERSQCCSWSATSPFSWSWRLTQTRYLSSGTFCRT